MKNADAEKWAVISECGKYRYLLGRRWAPGNLLVWIMLNPSVADAEQDDHTVRKCMGFARRMKMSGILILNLFAGRSTYPDDMKSMADPIGPGNAGFINLGTQGAEFVILGWGAHGSFAGRDKEVIRMLGLLGVKAKSFGKTTKGQPKHPLMLSYDTKLEDFHL